MWFVAFTSVGGEGDKFVQYKTTTISIVKTLETRHVTRKNPTLYFFHKLSNL